MAAGAAAAFGARTALHRAMLAKFRSDVRKLNDGRHESLLASYAPDAVLHFNDGDHRWAGEHRGKDAIGRFLRNFTGAGIQGEIKDLFISGPPWALVAIVRFDDHATHGGVEIYRNRTVLVVRTRWGRIVDHSDFYEDTERIVSFENKLRELGVEPAAA
jgi:ketosteroid isomerase-like protein